MGRPLLFTIRSLSLLALSLLALALVALSLVATYALADDLETVTGEKHNGTLTAITPLGEVSGEGFSRKLQLAELRSYARKAVKEVSAGKIVVEGHAGSKLNLQTLTFTGEEFRCACVSELTLSLPFDGLRAIRFEPGTPYAPFNDALAKPSKTNDLIFMKVEQQIEMISGLLAGITETEVAIDVAGEKRQLPRERVFGIVLAQSATAAAVSAIVAVEDGSRLAAKGIEVHESVWRLQLIGGSKCEVPMEKVWRVDFRPAGLIFLSDLEPLAVKEEPIFTPPAPWKRDRSVAGNALQLAGQKYEKGLGVHARSELAFAVPAESNLFLATIGIDDETRRESGNRLAAAGDCEFRVLGDDRELFAARLKSSQPPQAIRLELRNVKRLTLIVEPGEDFDFADHADWCDARFLKLAK